MTAQAIAANIATPEGRRWCNAAEAFRASRRALSTAIESYIVATDQDLPERRADMVAAETVARIDFAAYTHRYVDYAVSLRKPRR